MVVTVPAVDTFFLYFFYYFSLSSILYVFFLRNYINNTHFVDHFSLPLTFNKLQSYTLSFHEGKNIKNEIKIDFQHFFLRFLISFLVVFLVSDVFISFVDFFEACTMWTSAAQTQPPQSFELRRKSRFFEVEKIHFLHKIFKLLNSFHFFLSFTSPVYFCFYNEIDDRRWSFRCFLICTKISDFLKFSTFFITWKFDSFSPLQNSAEFSKFSKLRKASKNFIKAPVHFDIKFFQNNFL